MKQPIESLFGDLSSCFDRMFPKISNALAMKKGMTQSACESRGKVMGKMKIHVRTGVGTSKESYQEEEGDTPLEGKLQGKGNVMTLWTLTSNAIMSIHKKVSTMLKLVHVTKETISERNMNA